MERKAFLPRWNHFWACEKGAFLIFINILALALSQKGSENDALRRAWICIFHFPPLKSRIWTVKRCAARIQIPEIWEKLLCEKILGFYLRKSRFCPAHSSAILNICLKGMDFLSLNGNEWGLALVHPVRIISHLLHILPDLFAHWRG